MLIGGRSIVRLISTGSRRVVTYPHLRKATNMNWLVQAVSYFSSSSPAEAAINREQLLARRRQVIGSTCSLFFKDDPLVVQRASMQYLYDETGRKYLDCISNVQHVGHCHPDVVNAVTKQMNQSNCNLRFVNANLPDCAEALLKTLPGLDTVLFVNSGSEANDLALRLARDFTDHTDAIVIDHAYHGTVTTTMEMSPYKFRHGSSIVQPEWVHVAPCPDVYRGDHRLDDNDLENVAKLTEMGVMYADDVEAILKENAAKGRKVAAYFCEALQSCGGQVIPPPGYFKRVADYMHAAGGLFVADEVQTGFGRVGNTFWAHQIGNEGFVPDIVTMGKPMGNGFPVSAVVTRREIADRLGHNVPYFNTYGGNPVACAAVLAVLNVLQRDNLLEHSQAMGKIFHEQLMELKQRHQCIGDIRGVGLFFGLDIVKDRKTREPNTRLANDLILKLRRDEGVLLSTDGPYANVIKIKPPLCFSRENVFQTVNAIDKGLRELCNNN